MGILKELRRKRLRKGPFPAAWLAIMERNVPLYRVLPQSDREELKGHVLIFMAEKHFEGAGGLRMSDEIRVTIAALACILLLHRPARYYPSLDTVVVYPGEYMARRRTVDEAGVVTEGTEINAGESWETGVLVLSWEDVMMGCSHPGDGYNVVLHEFAHQLDAEEGLTDGVPPLRSREEYLDWIRVFQMEYDRLCRETAHGVETLIDPYGTESPAEFFAVATESFFEQAREMEAEHPELYRALQLFFRQDPARFEGSST